MLSKILSLRNDTKDNENSNDLWEERDQSHQECFTKFARVTKPKTLVQQMFYLSNLNLGSERKQTLPPLAPWETLQAESQGLTRKDSCLLPAAARMFQELSMATNDVQAGKFILLTVSALEEEVFPSNSKFLQLA